MKTPVLEFLEGCISRLVYSISKNNVQGGVNTPWIFYCSDL